MNIPQHNTYTSSTSDNNITPQLQRQQPSTRNYDPTPEYSTQTTPHTSPQQGSSNTHVTNIPQIQSTLHF